jgi:hypothetical protein
MKTIFQVAFWSFVLFCPLSADCQVLQSKGLGDTYSDKVSSFVLPIRQKNTSDYRRVKILFRRAHRNFLKKYKAYASVEDVFEKGRFDCLSGTCFLGLTLEKMGVKYRLIETNYHIFLIAQTNRGEVLLESTDRYNGFVANKKRIDERISTYRNNKIRRGSQLYLAQQQIYDEILPQQLPGLFYFNQAVGAFNRNNLELSCRLLENAWKIYDNPRIDEFTPILIRCILQSNLEETLKQSLVAVLKSHQHRYTNTLATR